MKKTAALFPIYNAFFVLVLLNLFACSKDDPATEDPLPILSFTAIANTGNETVQADVRTNRAEPVLVSLNEELNLQFLQQGRRQIDPGSIAYYTWNDRESRVFFKDLETGELFAETDICGFSSETDAPKAIRTIWGNREYVVMAYSLFPPNEPEQARLRVFSRAGDTCRDILLSTNGAAGEVDMLFREDLLIIYYTDPGTELPVLGLFDLSTGNQLTDLTLTEDFMSSALRDEELVIFGLDQRFEIFNTETLSFGTGGEIPDFPMRERGLFTTRFSGDNLLVTYIYQQPSLFFSQPALYDLGTGSFSAGAEPFLPLLQNRIENTFGERVFFGNFDADPDTGLIAIAYVKGGEDPVGGVAITDFEATPLQLIPLPIVPERIILR